MNAGGKYGSISDSLSSVTCLTKSGELVTYPAQELQFDYRECKISDPIILSATFELQQEDPVRIRESVLEIFAWKRSKQPLAETSAGCAFKNPKQQNGEQVSAGKLIDESGLKGFSIGGATVNSQHANFITTNPQATAQNVIAVMNEMKRRVFDCSGIKLQREVVVWSRDSESQ
jgi:UDP-N-acetylmuramate dehydrogenase